MRLALIVIGWIVLFILALFVDVPVATWFHTHLNIQHFKSSPLAKVLKSPGTFYWMIALTFVLIYFHGRKWRGPLVLWLSGILAGLTYTIGKWCLGRTRPIAYFDKPEAKDFGPFVFRPFLHGIKGLFVAERDMAFPSGHASFAFATAMAMTFIFPRQGILFFSIATLLGLERIAENAHYPSDVVAGAIFGVLSAYLARALVDRFCRTGRLNDQSKVELHG